MIEIVRKTHEEFANQMEAKHGDRFTLLGKYKGMKRRIEYRCNVCGLISLANAEHLYNRGSCQECSNNRMREERTKPHSQFVKEVKLINKTLQITGKYINWGTNVGVTCLVCRHKYHATPNNILRGRGCPKCARIVGGHKRRRTHEDFMAEFTSLNRSDLIVIGQYIGIDDFIECKCTTCEHVWNTSTAYSILEGVGCPRCNASRGERAVSRVLVEQGVKFETEKKFDGCVYTDSLRFDFYIPSKKLAIEYHGEQHYKSIEFFGGKDEFVLTQKRDEIKRRFCLENNIKLLEIPYWDFDKIEEIVISNI